MTGREGRRLKQLLDDLKETRRCCKLKGSGTRSLSGEFALEDAMDISWDRLRNE